MERVLPVRRFPAPALLAVPALASCAALALLSLACLDSRRPGVLEPERLVYLWETPVEAGAGRRFVAAPTFADWERGSVSFAGLAAFETDTFFLPAETGPVEVRGASVSPGLFEVLGVQPHLGRTFLASDARPASTGAAILGYELWQREFGGDPGIVGRRISIGLEHLVVLGVMPPGFAFPPPLSVDGRAPDETTELWLPLALGGEPRDLHDLAVIGRLAPGITLASAEAEMQAVAAAIAAEHPETNAGWSVILEPAFE